jgi:hypothetical protein
LILAGMITRPERIASIPTGKATISARKATIPAGKSRNQYIISALLFCRGPRQADRRRGRGRIGATMDAYLATDILELLGGGRAFAQHPIMASITPLTSFRPHSWPSANRRWPECEPLPFSSGPARAC